MALSDDERAAIRLHLGYSSLEQGVASGLGWARVEPQYQIVELAMTELNPTSEPDVRGLIKKMDDIECRIQRLSDTAATAKVGNITFAGTDGLYLLQEIYKRHGMTLADLLNVTPNIYSAKWAHLGASNGGVREGCY